MAWTTPWMKQANKCMVKSTNQVHIHNICSSGSIKEVVVEMVMSPGWKAFNTGTQAGSG
jgi:hypothetical protein